MGYSKNVPRLYAFVALTQFLLWFPIWIIFFQSRGIKLGTIGLLEMITLILMTCTEIPTGALADVWGRKKTLALGALLQGLATLGLLSGALSPIFLLSYAFWGVSLTFVSGAADAFLYDSLQADSQTDEFTRVSSRQFMFVQGSGAISSLLGGLIAAVDMRLCFLLTSVACFIAVGLVISLKEPPRHQHQSERVGYLETVMQGVSIVRNQRRVRYLILLGAVLQFFPLLLIMTVFQPYASEVGLPIWGFGIAQFVMRMAGIAGASLAPQLSERFRRELLVGITALVIVLAQALLWLVASTPALVLFAVVAMTEGTIVPVVSAMVNDDIPSSSRATVLSLQSMIFSLSLGVIQFAALDVAGRTSASIAIGMAGLLMAALVGPLLLLLQRAPVEPSSAALDIG